MEAVASIQAVGRAGGRRGLKAKRKKISRRRCSRPLKTRSYFYYALGDGVKSLFTLRDQMPGYASALPNPRKISLTNVFVDGILQSPLSYRLHPHGLQFISEHIPGRESRVIAQFIAIKR